MGSSCFIGSFIIVGLVCLHPITSEKDDDIKVLTYQVATLPLENKVDPETVVLVDQTVEAKKVIRLGGPRGDRGQTSITNVDSMFPYDSKTAAHRSGKSTISRHHPCSRRSTQEALQLMFENGSENESLTRAHLNHLKRLEQDLSGSDAAAILCRIRHRKLTKAENATHGEKLYDYIRDGQTDAVILLARHGCSTDDVSFNDTVFTDMQQFMSSHDCWADSFQKFYEKTTKQGSVTDTDGDHETLPRLHKKQHKNMNNAHALTRKCRILKKYQECKEEVAAAAAAAAAKAAAATTTKKPHRIGMIAPPSLRYGISDKEYDEFIFY